jgi:hypothetical protein
LITRVAYRPAGLRTLLRALLRFDVRTHRYALPLLAAHATVYLAALLFQVLSTNWWEEAVWLRFFQAALQRRYR